MAGKEQRTTKEKKKPKADKNKQKGNLPPHLARAQTGGFNPGGGQGGKR